MVNGEDSSCCTRFPCSWLMHVIMCVMCQNDALFSPHSLQETPAPCHVHWGWCGPAENVNWCSFSTWYTSWYVMCDVTFWCLVQSTFPTGNTSSMSCTLGLMWTCRQRQLILISASYLTSVFCVLTASPWVLCLLLYLLWIFWSLLSRSPPSLA